MRALLCLTLLACAPRVDPRSPSFDEDLGAPRPKASEPEHRVVERPTAPPGKGLRTGTIDRGRLNAVLDGGPGQFLRQLEVAPRMDGDRFVGWQLVQLIDHTGPLVDVDLVPGDVLLAINGKPVSRPDQLTALWDSLRTANTLEAELWRGATKLTLSFAIEPRL
jgi:hypothetical protein